MVLSASAKTFTFVRCRCSDPIPHIYLVGPDGKHVAGPIASVEDAKSVLATGMNQHIIPLEALQHLEEQLLSFRLADKSPEQTIAKLPLLTRLLDEEPIGPIVTILQPETPTGFLTLGNGQRLLVVTGPRSVV
jgi:hypothetical protein